jgi:hypothetical protein
MDNQSSSYGIRLRDSARFDTMHDPLRKSLGVKHISLLLLVWISAAIFRYNVVAAKAARPTLTTCGTLIRD